jgi:pimeloyl-ACP methyl ester carboxylesterase
MEHETLVMLPGMMCDDRLFAPQIAALKNDYHIIVPALTDDDSIEGMARRVLGGIPKLQFNLMGLSMGGILALAMVGLAPERVSRLALIDSTFKADAPERFALRNRQIEDVKQGGLRAVIRDEMKPNYLAFCNRSNKALLDLLIAMAMKLGEEAFISQSVALRDRPDHRVALTMYNGPTLFLCGSEDTLCAPALHREMAALAKNAVHREIKNAGHISTLEQPDAVNSALVSWLGIPCHSK